ncbi:4-hydroxybenzoate 3-monooxygenase [Umezawaea endophytica]|uniref:4-hydroxybenzoate 3-monooxygenase n=1 Tax=Umezawaea endophytica TaxID=1654476 RepID=A0A9X3AI08_9PSEU|nr:4-hydroxybenzoate 3-monooxygenase [Umezawaea endophytica]MCS7481876.1 4-hydroxybenzoate 3-monooxygenase [Umezawaea endophytica]
MRQAHLEWTIQSTALPVVIIGAGPAGLMVANLLQRADVPCVVLERGTREYIETRPRAGMLEDRSARMLERHGLADRMLTESDTHTACEFRIDGKAHELNYSELSDGKTHFVYPQQEVVTDLLRQYLDGGGDIRFEVSDVELQDQLEETPSVSWTSSDGTREQLDCSFIAGCDGFHGVTRKSIPAGAVKEFTHQHGIGWLSILAEAPPSTEKVIYALHADGFAGHMLRSSTVSRFYLQVPVGEDVDNWPDEKVWSELHKRLALRDSDWTLTEGKIIEKRVLDMRSHVVEPMRYGRLYLLGDAAHIITPMGGKGMNLALNDAEVFADAIASYYHHKSTTGLDDYSAVCLRRVWRAQEFSQWMVDLVHRNEQPFLSRLGHARLQHLIQSREAAASFAHMYVGAN